jgi:hypothetical protein
MVLLKWGGCVRQLPQTSPAKVGSAQTGQSAEFNAGRDTSQAGHQTSALGVPHSKQGCSGNICAIFVQMFKNMLCKIDK